MRILIFFFLSILSFGCAVSSANDFKTAKQIDSGLDGKVYLLDKKYVGFTRENFIADFGKPRKTIKDKYPYSLQAGCNSADCPSGWSDEMLVYEFSLRTKYGITYYSVYAFIKDGVVVRMR